MARAESFFGGPSSLMVSRSASGCANAGAGSPVFQATHKAKAQDSQYDMVQVKCEVWKSLQLGLRIVPRVLRFRSRIFGCQLAIEVLPNWLVFFEILQRSVEHLNRQGISELHRRLVCLLNLHHLELVLVRHSRKEVATNNETRFWGPNRMNPTRRYQHCITFLKIHAVALANVVIDAAAAKVDVEIRIAVGYRHKAVVLYFRILAFVSLLLWPDLILKINVAHNFRTAFIFAPEFCVLTSITSRGYSGPTKLQTCRTESPSGITMSNLSCPSSRTESYSKSSGYKSAVASAGDRPAAATSSKSFPLPARSSHGLGFHSAGMQMGSTKVPLFSKNSRVTSSGRIRGKLSRSKGKSHASLQLSIIDRRMSASALANICSLAVRWLASCAKELIDIAHFPLQEIHSSSSLLAVRSRDVKQPEHIVSDVTSPRLRPGFSRDASLMSIPFSGGTDALREDTLEFTFPGPWMASLMLLRRTKCASACESMGPALVFFAAFAGLGVFLRDMARLEVAFSIALFLVAFLDLPLVPVRRVLLASDVSLMARSVLSPRETVSSAFVIVFEFTVWAPGNWAGVACSTRAWSGSLSLMRTERRQQRCLRVRAGIRCTSDVEQERSLLYSGFGISDQRGWQRECAYGDYSPAGGSVTSVWVSHYRLDPGSTGRRPGGESGSTYARGGGGDHGVSGRAPVGRLKVVFQLLISCADPSAVKRGGGREWWCMCIPRGSTGKARYQSPYSHSGSSGGLRRIEFQAAEKAAIRQGLRQPLD
ncbi:Clavaminate synthase-like protein [Hortaea werneckii]|nr:Clavaminate synthase-like protein [Hortaea werneckii]